MECFQTEPPERQNRESAESQESPSPFVIVDGRRLFIDAPYLLPTDLPEHQRLDVQHVLMQAVLQNPYQAPLVNPGEILDVGCGTGRWAYEMAQLFPQATVVGCDLVEPPAGALSVPSNYRFVQADVLKGLPFPDQSFDFVHQRFLVLALPAHVWPGVLRELVRVARVGGWVEVVEAQVSADHAGASARQLTDWIIELGRQRGIECGQFPPFAEELRQAGLASVIQRHIAIPLGKWGGQIGTMMQANGVAGVRAMKPLILSQLGVSAEEFDRVLAGAIIEYDQFQMTVPYLVVYGQRLASSVALA